MPKKNPIKVYHAVDAHNRDGEFKGWDRPKTECLCREASAGTGATSEHGLSGGHQYGRIMRRANIKKVY